jgi:hypothetical protein
MVKNKRAWVRILEATVAVMLVSAVMVLVYMKQTDDRASVDDYFYTLQKQILDEVASRSDLRLLVLNDNVAALDDFISSKMPDGINYTFKLCELASPCVMTFQYVLATVDKQVFVDEIIIAADLGDGTNEIYNPTKIKLFFWEDIHASHGFLDNCSNGNLDPGETDVDCGGPDCFACPLAHHCLINHDCLTDNCSLNICVMP